MPPLPSCGSNKITYGTCGWSYNQAPWKNSLHNYSHGFNFGCVEIDSSTYNYPSETTVTGWVKKTPKNFLFHVKLFGFLCSRAGSSRSLPLNVRSLLKETALHSEWVKEKDLGNAGVKMLWDMSNAMLEPFVKAKKMGCVLLQFHLTFKPNPTNTEYIRRCRRRLRSDVRMAIEFRDRSWLHGNQRAKTLRFLSNLPATGLVASDDLQHELHQRDRDQQGLTSGAKRIRLRPTIVPEIQPEFLYCRVHRRHGNDRLLRHQALQDWCNLLSQVTNSKIYFLWGTDCRDQPILNAKALDKLLPERLKLNWQQELRMSGSSRKGSLLSMLSSNISSTPKEETNITTKTKTNATSQQKKKSKPKGLASMLLSSTSFISSTSATSSASSASSSQSSQSETTVG